MFQGKQWNRFLVAIHNLHTYSPGGKINKVTRSGLFVANRISQGTTSLTDIYHYSSSSGENNQEGILQSVTSSDSKETAQQFFKHDAIGFREYGVSPTLAVLAANASNVQGNNNRNLSNSNNNSSSWKTASEIPMQKYIWSGNGSLQGVYSAKHEGTNVVYNELLTYRMFDEQGSLLAEFDGVQLEEMINASSGTIEKPQVKNNKLPRFVNVSSGVSFERDELHFNVELGSFASLDLITRYPNLNASSPDTIKNEFQSRKELRVKDNVGSVSIVIDLDTKKIVERNASEPFGLARGIPLLSNSVLNQYAAQGNREEAKLYSNSQSNNRANWEKKSFEVVGNSSPNEMQGMHASEVFALGKFSASTGLHTMGVRAYDPARGIWMSPDLYIGQSLEVMLESPEEANLFQYAGNNPVAFHDPSGEVVPLVWGIISIAFRIAAIEGALAVRESLTDVAIDIAVEKIREVVDASKNNTEQAVSDISTNNTPTNKPNWSEINAKGKEAEDVVSDFYGGISKNYTRYTVGINNGEKNYTTTPDFMHNNMVIEVKNTNVVNHTDQIKAEIELAKREKMSFQLHVDVRTHVSGEIMKKVESRQINKIEVHDFKAESKNLKEIQKNTEKNKEKSSTNRGKETSTKGISSSSKNGSSPSTTDKDKKHRKE
jgi:RHS repeat-associated protein